MTLTFQPAKRTPKHLSESLCRPLNAYTLAAVAAGVSLLAMTQPAEAKVVYTPANVMLGHHGVHPLDLNHDGIVDFNLVADFSYLSTFSFFGTLSVRPAQHFNGISDNSVSSARALTAGAKIGPGGAFGSARPLLDRTVVDSCVGQWCNVTSRYLGLRFVVAGKTHFGWARLDVKLGSHGTSAVLTGYAYETTPNKAIIAGQVVDVEQVGNSVSSTESNHLASESVSLGALTAGYRRPRTVAQENQKNNNVQP